MPAGWIYASFITQMLTLFFAITIWMLRPSIKRSEKILTFYFIVAGVVDIIGVVMALNGLSNLLLYRLFNLAEFILLAYLYYLIDNQLQYKLSIIFITVVLFLYLLGGNLRHISNTEFPVYYMALPNLVLFVMSLRELYWTMVSKVNPIKEGQLWATLAFSFYFSISSLGLLLWTAEYAYVGTIITIIANIIKNIIILWSFRCIWVKEHLS